MLTLLSFLIGWAEGWLASGRPDVSVVWEESPSARDKRAVWINVQGPSAYGQLTVWETGEVFTEAMLVETGELTISEHAQVTTVEELAVLVRRLIATCEA